MDALRLGNAVTAPASAVRCAGCREWGDPDLMAKERSMDGGLVTTEYRHTGCMDDR